jgi:hypothetical protein
MNGTILLDNELIEEVKKIIPAANTFTLQRDPGVVSGFLSLPKPVVSTMSNWLTGSIDTDPNKLALMEQLFS